jgi:hypothetical protein
MYLGKPIENRTWYTRFRGEFLIHAGLTVDKNAIEDLREDIERLPKPRPTCYLGALVAKAELVDSVRAEDLKYPEGDWRWSWVTGPWCFVLANVKPLTKPIALKGQLGFFEIDNLLLNQPEQVR